jgi:GNAT superfamily N-acetyltransferase
MSLHGDIEIEKLRRDHAVQTFDCGQLDLNSWLVRYALQNQNANAAQTYVAMADLTVAGYYSLSVGQVEHASAPTRLQKGLARHPIPVMLLARLAVHEDWQRRGVGRLLLADAVVRTVRAAEIAGVRALAVHAKDENARRYYERYDFIASPSDPLHMFALLRDIREAMAG